MTTNLHLNSFNQFLTDVAKYEQQIKNPRSTPADIDNVVEFINANQDWMNFIAQHPSANRESVKKLSERLRRIGSAEGEEVAKIIDQYLTTDIFLSKDAMKEVLRHTGKDMHDPVMRKTLASASKASKSMRQASDEVRIEWLNKNRPKLNDIGFKNAEEAIKFLINSPAKDRVNYVNFEGFPLNNEQFEKLTRNCPNLHHIEIPRSIVSGDSLKHLANLKNLQSLNIRGCDQLEGDALKHLANLTSLQSLDIGRCRQLKRDSLKHIAKLTNLQSLNIRECNQLEGDALENLANLTNLQSLDMRWYMLKGDALKYLANLKNLQSLDMRWCDQLERDALKHLANLTNLQSLNIWGCTNLERDALKYLVNLTNLQTLDIAGCKQLESNALTHIASLTNLQTLDIAGCTQLESDALKHLANLINLQSLNIGYCTQLESDALKHLANLTNLQSLSIGGCSQLQSCVRYLLEMYGDLITGKKLETLLNKLRNEL